MARNHIIIRISMLMAACLSLGPIIAVLICRALSDPRTYIALAGLSVLAYLVVRHRRPVDGHRSGLIERAPYDITGAQDRRREP